MREDRLYGVTMCVEPIDDLLVIVHTDDPPAKDEWSRQCRYTAALREERGELRILVVATRIVAGPNASQRVEFSSTVAREQTRVAVLCDTFAARAALNALALFNPNMRAFDSHRIDEAVEYLERPLTDALTTGIERMRRHMREAQRRPSGRH